jgi:hypothetical protein
MESEPKPVRISQERGKELFERLRSSLDAGKSGEEREKMADPITNGPRQKEVKKDSLPKSEKSPGYLVEWERKKEQEEDEWSKRFGSDKKE